MLNSRGHRRAAKPDDRAPLPSELASHQICPVWRGISNTARPPKVIIVTGRLTALTVSLPYKPEYKIPKTVISAPWRLLKGQTCKSPSSGYRSAMRAGPGNLHGALSEFLPDGGQDWPANQEKP
jgi:hypothetical protein